MHTFTVSETVDGAELQISLRLQSEGLAAFLGGSVPSNELEETFRDDLHPIRCYMAALAAKLPELHRAGHEVLLRHQLAKIQRENAVLVEKLKNVG